MKLSVKPRVFAARWITCRWLRVAWWAIWFGAAAAGAQEPPLVPMAPRADERAGLPGANAAFTAVQPVDDAQSSADPAAPPAQAKAASLPVAPAPQPDEAALGGASEVAAAADETPHIAGHDTESAAPATEPAAPAAGKLPGVPARKHPVAPDAAITIAFHDADLSAALQAFAEFTGLNIVASERVRGKTSLALTRVPWRHAFRTLLEVNGLAMQQSGDVIWVAPAADVAAREKQRLEATARLNDLEPLASRIFILHYQRAEDVRKLLAGGGNQRVLSKRGSAMADPRTDHLFVTDLPATLEQIAGLIKVIDQPARQVLIESRIVEADESFARNLGARLALLGDRAERDSSPVKGVHGGAQGNIYDLPAGGLAGYGAAALGLTLFSAGDSRLLMLELSALEAQGHGRIVSSPRIVTADRVRALIEQGTELPYQAQVDTGVSAVQFRRAGLKLEVVPHITPDRHVMLDVDVTKDSVGSATTAGPAINTKHVQTQVQVDNGGTVAIGGIYLEDERNDISRVPWLGSLPVIGGLFRHRAVQHSKSELMIFITPSEVAPLQPGSAPTSVHRVDDGPGPQLPAIPEIPQAASEAAGTTIPAASRQSTG
jgi:type IV pilus assembly protein PilQ